MGVVLAMGHCYTCGQPFSYNPHHVPSVPIHPVTNKPAPMSEGGIRQPICRACIDMANPQRIENGLDPIVPHPDAYEPLDEYEL